MDQYKNKQFLSTAIGTIFFIAAFFLLKTAFQPEEFEKKLSSQSPHQVSVNSPEAEKAVNKYLKEINKSIEMQQLQSRIQNQNIRPKVGEVISPNAFSRNNKKQNLKVDSLVEQNSSHHIIYDTNSPSGQIQLELAEQQRLEEYDQKYKEEYIRQFIENAKRNGWKITVDENGTIKSAAPINREQNPRLFDGSPRLSNQ